MNILLWNFLWRTR